MTDFEITTHIRCPERALPELLQRFAKMLCSQGFTGVDLDNEFAHVTWEPDGSGFGYLCEPLANERISINGRSVAARPYILGYTDSKGIEVPWVQLSLVFEGASIELVTYSINGPSSQKLRGSGSAIWQLAQAYSAEFPESSIFFGDGPSVNFPWEALSGLDGDLWRFDLALIPLQLATRFSPIPEGYAHISVSGSIAIAPRDAWEVLPWLEI